MPDFSKKGLQSVAFGAPIPGQSWTSPPKNAQWEKPPQFVKAADAMNFLMNQLTDFSHQKELLRLIEGGIPIEAIVRTILFSGFASGKWTVDIAIILYKPLMLALISMAHRAGFDDAKVLMPQAVNNKKKSDLQMFSLVQRQNAKPNETPSALTPSTGASGFMQRKS